MKILSPGIRAFQPSMLLSSKIFHNEAIVNGKYYWIPFTAVKQIQIEEPSDLRDLVWIPAYFTWANEGQASGLIPTRYPGSESSQDDAIRLSRKTDWIMEAQDVYLGLGQRLFTTDKEEYPLLQIRSIELNCEEIESQGGAGNG